METYDQSKKRVDFFIVGAMKSGTTSLRNALNQHPRIDIHKREIHRFYYSDIYNKGVEWYHSHFDFSNDKILYGDKSTSYSWGQEAPKRIYQYNPNAKIVWILRDPVKRVISNFHHAKKRNPEAMSIEESLDLTEGLAKKMSPSAYIYRSQYDRHLANFTPFFPMNQHYIVIFEEMLRNPDIEIRKLIEWLGLPANGPLLLPHSNDTGLGTRMEYPVSLDTENRIKQALAPTVRIIESLLSRPIPLWS